MALLAEINVRKMVSLYLSEVQSCKHARHEFDNVSNDYNGKALNTALSMCWCVEPPRHEINTEARKHLTPTGFLCALMELRFNIVAWNLTFDLQSAKWM